MSEIGKAVARIALRHAILWILVETNHRIMSWMDSAVLIHFLDGTTGADDAAVFVKPWQTLWRSLRLEHAPTTRWNPATTILYSV